jgi:branched-chain amino acid transport system substrate-binding protein
VSRLAVVALATVAVAVGASATTATPTTTVRPAAAVSVRGVTPRTVVVAGLLAGAGAEVGAQARFHRANRRGGIAGRKVRYVGTEVDGGDAAVDATAVAKLSANAFAVVPAISPVLDTSALASARLPFVGVADSVGWNANRYGFGFTGAQLPLQSRVVNPAWGVQLRSLMGHAQGEVVAIATDESVTGATLATQTRTSLRAAGFRVVAPVALPAPPAPTPDLAAVAGGLATGSPAAVVLLTSPSTTAGLARQLANGGYTGTVATSAAFYQPTLPGVANGLTVLVPYAPVEARTTATRRLMADVTAFAPDAPVTAAVVAGYWAADQFLALLTVVGRRLTVARFLGVANGGGFHYEVADTVGRSSWPAMHTRSIPCGALVQSDGSQYYVVSSYRCDAPVVPKAKSRRRTG